MKGVSVTKISRELKIPDTTIGRWVRDISSDYPSSNRAKLNNLEQKEKYKHILANTRISKNEARLLCSLIYWCEGSKYPSSNFIAFSNSDHRLVRTFLFLFKRAFEVDMRKVRIHLQIHSDHDSDKTRSFWSELLEVPPTQFYKPTVTDPMKKMKRLDYQGTCTLKYFDSKLLLQITGIFEEFAKLFGEVA